MADGLVSARTVRPAAVASGTGGSPHLGPVAVRRPEQPEQPEPDRPEQPEPAGPNNPNRYRGDRSPMMTFRPDVHEPAPASRNGRISST